MIRFVAPRSGDPNGARVAFARAERCRRIPANQGPRRGLPAYEDANAGGPLQNSSSALAALLKGAMT